MKTSAIIKELSTILPKLMVEELKMAMVLKRSITICCTINDIIHDFDCDSETEKKVAKLLESLCKNHFS